MQPDTFAQWLAGAPRYRTGQPIPQHEAPGVWRAILYERAHWLALSQPGPLCETLPICRALYGLADI